MEYGICGLSLVPVRVQPGDQHEMINQLLFGDLLVIKGRVHDWALAETVDDQYEGWVDKKQIISIPKDEFNEIISSERSYLFEMIAEIIDTDENYRRVITMGSMLPNYNKGIFNIANQNYFLEKKTTPKTSNSIQDNIGELAVRYLGSPYLWGGRSPFGIDCSGLVQIVFKMCGIYLPRDSAEQVKEGLTVDFISESKKGDLAFFGNEEGNIIHVGIVLDQTKIIHASGKVRIDNLDHQGIFNKDSNTYTHQLRIIKRMI